MRLNGRRRVPAGAQDVLVTGEQVAVLPRLVEGLRAVGSRGDVSGPHEARQAVSA
jgi:hypothetical protein